MEQLVSDALYSQAHFATRCSHSFFSFSDFSYRDSLLQTLLFKEEQAV
jgi:hypothetical protein